MDDFDKEFLVWIASHFEVSERIELAKIKHVTKIETSIVERLRYFECGENAYLTFNTSLPIGDDNNTIRDTLLSVAVLKDLKIIGYLCKTLSDEDECSDLREDELHFHENFYFQVHDDSSQNWDAYYLWCINEARLR